MGRYAVEKNQTRCKVKCFGSTSGILTLKDYERKKVSGWKIFELGKSAKEDGIVIKTAMVNQ